MTPEPPSNPTAAALRRQAEASLRKRPKHQTGKPAETTPSADTQRLLHELQVHQVELEMQNAELQTARDRMETLLEKYTDLYDFSPVGYFTLGPEGKITLVNLTGARLVGITRNKLTGQSFTLLITPDQRPAFRTFLDQVFADEGNQEADFHLLLPDQTARVLKIRAQRSPSGQECSAVVVDITERIEAEAKVQQNELRLSLGVKVSGMALAEVDYLTDKKHLSAEAAHLFGLGDTAMVVPRSVVHALFHPDDLALLQPLVTAAVDPEGDGWLALDHRIIRPNGEMRWLRVREKIFFDGPPKARRPIRAAVALLDITPEKMAMEALHASEERMRLATEATAVGIWEWNVLTNEIRWDAQMFRIYGLTPSPSGIVPYTAWSTAVLPEDLPQQEAVVQDTIRRRGRSSRTFRILRADDHECRTIQCFEAIRTNAEGQAEWVVGTNLDITERLKAEETLHRSEALFTAMIEKAPFGVYVVDAAFRLQQLNPKSQLSFVGVHPLIGRDFAEIVRHLWPKRAADKLLARFRHTLKTGEPYQSPEFTEKRRDTGNQEVYEWQIQRVTLPAGEHGVVCFFNNITERKRSEWVRRRLDILTASNQKLEEEIIQRQLVEKSLKRSERDQRLLLKQAQQMQKKLRSFSHQIITAQEDERKRISRELHDVIAQTLVGINVHLGTLTRAAEGTPKSLLVKIQRTQQLVEKAADTVHQFARELRPTVLDDVGLIPALEAHLKGFMEETGVRSALKVTAGIEAVIGTRRTTLFRIAQEALTNVARHAQASNVTITLISLKDGTIRMEITDDGRGFEADGKSGAARNKRLGLLGMRERVEMINGTFNIDSTPGGPTTVRVEIPVS